VAELIAPFFAFWPRIGRHIAGIIMIALQLVLILSGNLSFLNWLTIVPALACFDDGFWCKMLPKALVRKAHVANERAEYSKPMMTTAWIITALIALLSIEPALNIISPGQIMNTSFDPLDLVNTYGAFGSVGQERYNVVFEGTADNDSTDKANWKPYIYKGLPVLLNKRPPQIAPYQLRLDWQMWFASMSTPEEYPWTFNLVWKMLHNDKQITGLFADNPFGDKAPTYIRAVLYRYSFAKPGNSEKLFWNRQRLSLWIPPLSSTDTTLINYIKGVGWER